MKTEEILSQNSQYLDQDSNCLSSKCKSEALLLEPNSWYYLFSTTLNLHKQSLITALLVNVTFRSEMK
jgi:hypothetical protein